MINAGWYKTVRHRLNRGGDRQANSALHIIAIGRLRIDPKTKTYVAKRIAAGHSKLDAIRALKRYIAREVFGILARRQTEINPDPHRGLTNRRASMAQMSQWRALIEEQFGVDVAHKAMKIWRALWGVMQAPRYTQLSDPSKKVTNTAPQSRTARYSQAEAIRLAKTAWRQGYRGLACIIITCWDAGFQPADARTARAKHLKTDPVTGRYFIDRSTEGRQKTGVAVIGTLSRLGDAMVRRYIGDLGVDLHQEAFLFRTRTGVPYRELAVSRDFYDIRAIVDPADLRQLRDMRRSGTTEAFRGGADSKAVSQKFGNSIDRSAFLFKTYNPVDIEQVRQADEARVRGRRRGAK